METDTVSIGSGWKLNLLNFLLIEIHATSLPDPFHLTPVVCLNFNSIYLKIYSFRCMEIYEKNVFSNDSYQSSEHISGNGNFFHASV